MIMIMLMVMSADEASW